MRLLILLVAAGALRGACLEVEGERIMAGDLARAIPQFAAAPADATFGFAPQPGVSRNISNAELRRFATMHGVQISPEATACVEYPVHSMSAAEVLEALRRGFGESATEIELVEFSRTGVPRGTLIFERRGLAPPAVAPAAPLLWRGYVRYSSQRRSAVWAKVRVFVTEPQVISAVSMPAGHAITDTDIRVSTARRPWNAEPLLADAGMVVGRVAVRPIPADVPLRPEWLAAAAPVKTGDPVEVSVRNGGAVLQFTAKAATTAQVGESVVLVNPLNGKTFKATVESRRTALLEVARTTR